MIFPNFQGVAKAEKNDSVAHTFLLEPGRWILQGSWLEGDGVPIAVKGQTIVAWRHDDWFTMVTMLVFPPEKDRKNITFQYKGRLNAGDWQYTFVLQHNELGRVEGQGWIAPESIVQRYWVLNDPQQRRTGFETLHRINDNAYYLSSAVMSRDLISTMEATVERQPG